MTQADTILLARWQSIDGEGRLVAVEIDLDYTVDRFAEDGDLVECGLKQSPLQASIDGGQQDDQSGVQRLRCVELSEVGAVSPDPRNCSLSF